MRWWRSTPSRYCDSRRRGGAPLEARRAEYALAVRLRKRGLSHSEIQAYVPVSQSTLSLWLRSLRFTPRQQERLARLRVRGAQAGAMAVRRARRQRIDTMRAVGRRQGQERLEARDVRWVVGTVLYWGEGSKAKPWRGKERVIFTNMDPRAVRIFRQWLVRYMNVKRADIVYDLYTHATADTTRARSYWGKELHVAPAHIRVYFKPPSHSSRRTHIGRVYYGTMRIAVRRSTMLAYRIDGCIQEVIEHCGVV